VSFGYKDFWESFAENFFGGIRNRQNNETDKKFNFNSLVCFVFSKKDEKFIRNFKHSSKVLRERLPEIYVTRETIFGQMFFRDSY
jgi:hypothetical protein